MCHNKSIAQTDNGNVRYCRTCQKYTVEYKNLCFSFSEKDYIQFRDYFIQLDAEYWEYKNADTSYRRKIIVPVGHKKLVAVFNKNEIVELQALFGQNQQQIYQRDIAKALRLSSYTCLN